MPGMRRKVTFIKLKISVVKEEKIRYIMYNIQDYTELFLKVALNIIDRAIKIIAFSIITLFARVYTKCTGDGILLTYGNTCISVRGKAWTHKTSFISATFYWRACIMSWKWAVIYLCVRYIDFASFYDFDIGLWIYSDRVVFCVFHFIFLKLSIQHFLHTSIWDLVYWINNIPAMKVRQMFSNI